MAGTDQLDITFYGIGGYGSTPQFTKDPVIMATTAVNNYQSIISRTIEPKEAAVLTVGSIRAGDDNNVIPSTALLKLNLRWFNERERKTMIEGIERISERSVYSYRGASPSVMGSEDFHHLVIHNDKKDYCFINLGIAEPERFAKSFNEYQAPPFNNHNGDFKVDLRAISVGSKVATTSLLTIFERYK